MLYLFSNSLRAITFGLASLIIFNSCSKKNENAATPDTGCSLDIALTTFAQDRELGSKIDSQIVATPAEYPLLDSVKYATAYSHLKRITTNIRNSGKIGNEKELVWKIKIIQDDATLNAFCTPGGYIYVYTGIIKYLDNEDDFAGVLGHEIAHADLRHSAKTLTRTEGIDALLSIILGKAGSQSTLVNLTKNLSGLSYSRCHETQADENSVGYLSGTSYKCNGAATFFQKLVSSGASTPPVFMSTHPDPGSRVENINAKAVKQGCNTTIANPNGQYAAFKGSLP